MNRCPACQLKIKAHEVACRRHWLSLPKPIRDEIWRLYRSERGSDAHRAAVFKAIEMLAPKPEQTKVRCMKCGFLVGKAGPCSEHSPFRDPA